MITFWWIVLLAIGFPAPLLAEEQPSFLEALRRMRFSSGIKNSPSNATTGWAPWLNEEPPPWATAVGTTPNSRRDARSRQRHTQEGLAARLRRARFEVPPGYVGGGRGRPSRRRLSHYMSSSSSGGKCPSSCGPWYNSKTCAFWANNYVWYTCAKLEQPVEVSRNT